MSTNSQLMGRFLRGQTLDEAEIQQIERALSDYDRASGQVTGWAGNEPQSPKFSRVKVQELFSEMSIGHAISYTRATALNIASDTEVTVTWDGGKRGQGGHPETHACLLPVGGDYSKFTYAPWAETDRSILVFGDFSFSTNGVGDRTVYLNSFDAAGNPGGATTFNVRAAVNDITTVIFLEHLTLDKGHYTTVSLWQDSGSPLTMDQGNLGFMLI